MAKRINVLDAVVDGEELTLKTIPDADLNGLAATGRMLVDSDRFAFVYLTESKNEYTYIVLPEPVWPHLKKSIDSNLTAFIVNNGTRLELVDFNDELNYVTNNIKGNYNYGEEMVVKVGHIF